MLRRTLVGLFAAATLFACVPEKTQAPTTGGQTHIVASAFWGEPVFDNDVSDFVSMMRASSRHSLSVKTLSAQRVSGNYLTALSNTYKETRAAMNEGDQLVSFITSHGYIDIVGIQTSSLKTILSGTQLDALFAPFNGFPHVIIIQACYSGSLIPTMATANRIIITAADESHPSFGCAPDAKNTWFTKALKQEIKKGRSWAQIFAATKARVTAYEKAQGVPIGQGSNPQIYIGKNMKDIANAPI